MASVDNSSSNNKRRRTATVAADNNSDLQEIIYLSDLTIGILDHTASFLAPPSRALFAVALTNDNHKPNENSSSIVAADDWDILDFGEIEKELAARLSDYDISDVLQHIDAVNKLKRLRLTNCIRISGICLEPLRRSTIIEQIDLSLTDDGESPKLDPEPPISYYAVLPILDSIISRPCALKHLQFPYMWRRDRSTDSEFHTFIVRYNEMRRTRGDTFKCFHCNKDLAQTGENRWILTDDDDIDIYGTHCQTCYQCTKHYCYCDTCLEEEEEEVEDHLQYCDNCHRDYCAECVNVEECRVCDDKVCEYCDKFECNKCNGKICSGCIESQNDCADCGKFYCVQCIQSDEGMLGDQEGIFICEGCKD